MLYSVTSAFYQRYLARPAANEVLSAHSTIAKLVSYVGGTAVFGVKHYLRYAQLSVEKGDPPQKEWVTTIGQADAQTARFVDEAEGSIGAVIASLKVGSLVALDWLQVGVLGGGVECPCQKLEPIGKATEEKLLAASPEVRALATRRVAARRPAAPRRLTRSGRALLPVLKLPRAAPLCRRSRSSG